MFVFYSFIAHVGCNAAKKTKTKNINVCTNNHAIINSLFEKTILRAFKLRTNREAFDQVPIL